MDQKQIGNFIKELRKEKGITQEELAERFYVARRTVSRWETGSNLPDLDILMQMSDFFSVDLRELLDGERKSEKMDKELEATVLKVADYSNEKQKKTSKVVLIYLVAGLVGLIANTALRFADLPETFWAGFAEGSTLGLALCAIIMAILYVTGKLAKITEAKKKLLND